MRSEWPIKHQYKYYIADKNKFFINLTFSAMIRVTIQRGSFKWVRAVNPDGAIIRMELIPGKGVFIFKYDQNVIHFYTPINLFIVETV